jgi:acetyl esterase/lipase
MTGGRVTLQSASVNDVRDQFGGIFAGIIPFLPPPNDDAVKTEDVQVRKDLRVRTYVPTGLKDLLPVGLYIHCGGWFTGGIEEEEHPRNYLTTSITQPSTRNLKLPSHPPQQESHVP